MKKILLLTALFATYLFSTSYTAASGPGKAIIRSTAPEAQAELLHSGKSFAGISIHPAPAPPFPYTQSVYFKYDGQNVGNKFKVESNDGCPFYAVVNGSPVTYTPTLSAEYIFGVFFKSETGCSTTRNIKVYYDDNGSWSPYQIFTVNL